MRWQRGIPRRSYAKPRPFLRGLAVSHRGSIAPSDLTRCVAVRKFGTLPQNEVESLAAERARSLRTQQRVTCQCQLPRSGAWLNSHSRRRIPLVRRAHSSVCHDQTNLNGEFDPGSGRTLAACLTHASRTVKGACSRISGERVSNTWATCPRLWDNSSKEALIPDTNPAGICGVGKFFGLGWARGLSACW